MAVTKFLTDINVPGIIGQTIYLGSSSGMINRSSSQFAADGTNIVYIGSNNYGWNDARDWATMSVDSSTSGGPLLSHQQQHAGIICPTNISQLTIKAQVQLKAADGVIAVKVYKANRVSGGSNNLTLEEIGSSTVEQTSNQFHNHDIVGTTSVTAGQLIFVGVGKRSAGNGQKPRFNFTLTGTTE